MSYRTPALFNVQESVRENHKWVEFSLFGCYDISAGQSIKFNGIDCTVVSLVFDISMVTVSAISIRILNEICSEIWDSLDSMPRKLGILRSELKTSNGIESFQEPISEYDKDVDSILEKVFATDYEKEITDLQKLKQINKG